MLIKIIFIIIYFTSKKVAYMANILNSSIALSMGGDITSSLSRGDESTPASNSGMSDLDQRIANLREKLANLAQIKAKLSNSVESLTSEYKDAKGRARMAKRIWQEIKQPTPSPYFTKNEPEEGEPENPLPSQFVTPQIQQDLPKVVSKLKREDDKEKNDEEDPRFSNDRQRRLENTNISRWTGKRDRDCYETQSIAASSQSSRVSAASPLAFISQLPPLISPPPLSRFHIPTFSSDLLALQKEIFSAGTEELISNELQPLAKSLMREVNHIGLNLLNIIQSVNNSANSDCFITIQTFFLAIRHIKYNNSAFNEDENYISQILYRAFDTLHSVRHRITPFDQQHIDNLCQAVCAFLAEQLKTAFIFKRYEKNSSNNSILESHLNAYAKGEMLNLILHKFSLTLWPLLAWISHNGDSESQLFVKKLATLFSKSLHKTDVKEYPYALLLPTQQLIQICSFNIDMLHTSTEEIAWSVCSEVLLKEIESRSKIDGDLVGQGLYNFLYQLTTEVEEMEDQQFAVIKDLFNLLTPSLNSTTIIRNAKLSLKICDILDQIEWQDKKYTRQAFRALHMATLGQPEEAIKLYMAGKTFPSSSQSNDAPIWIHLIIAILYFNKEDYRSARICLLRLGGAALQDQGLTNFYNLIFKNIHS